MDQVRPLIAPLISLQKAAKLLDENDRRAYTNKFDMDLDSFPEIPELRFLPMFSRSNLPGHGRPVTVGVEDWEGMQGVLPSPPQLPSSDDLPTQNMRLVDEWTTILTSSPPLSPTSQQSSEDMVDQLAFPPTPDTDPPLVEEISNNRLSTPLFPRSRRVGGRSGVKPHIAKDESIETFLPAVIPGPFDTPRAETKPAVHSPIPATSMIGQASVKDEVIMDPNLNDDLDTEIRHLCQAADPGLMNEKLDEKAIELMDVPELPEPMNHSRPKWIPANMRQLMFSCDNAKDPSELGFPLVVKASGRQSITVSLSWVAYTLKEPLPSLDQILLLDHPLASANYEVVDSVRKDVDGLITNFSALIETSHFPLYDGILASDDLPQLDDPTQPQQLLLTRRERQRASEKRAHDSLADHELSALSAPRSAKRRKQDRPALDDSGCVMDETLFMPADPDDLLKADAVINEEMGLLDDVDHIMVDPIVEGGRPWLEDEKAAYWNPQAIYSEEEKENWNPSFDRRSDLTFDLDLSRGNPSEPGAGTRFEQFDAVLEDNLGGMYQQEPFPVDEQDSNPEQTAGGDRLRKSCPSTRVESENLALDHQHELVVPSVSLGILAKSIRPAQGLAVNAQKLEKTLFSHASGLLNFAQIRSVKLPLRSEGPRAPSPETRIASDPDASGSARTTVPADRIDKHTFQISDTSSLRPETVHRYMASLDVLQKRSLVKALASDTCLVELVERTSLHGVHLILDGHTAVIFIPLFTLPSEYASWLNILSAHSWKFSAILVIFEAYPESCALRSKERESGLNAYTKPILKAVGMLRRGLALEEGFGRKSGACEVRWAFADCVLDAAKFVRLFGEMAFERDITVGAVWEGGREWLDDEHEDEADLATVHALNHFSAALILAHVSLEDFLQMSSQERTSLFAPFIGIETINAVNADIERRFQLSSELDGLQYGGVSTEYTEAE